MTEPRQRIVRVVSAGAAVLAVAAGLVARAPAASGQRTLVRVNQAGYATGADKQAVVISNRPLGHGHFSIAAADGRVVLGGRLGRSRGRWNRAWPYTYRIGFSRLRRTGSYRLRVANTTATIRVGRGADLYAPLAGNAIRFFEEQRDGPAVLPGALPRAPAHLLDGSAAIYAVPRYRGSRLIGSLRPTGDRIDVSGGWFDAGDYLKFTETAAFDDDLMLLALRDESGSLPNAAALSTEARFGTDWLLKMWDESRGVLYYQVGIGDGNGNVTGDHDLWRLPQLDDRIGAKPGSPNYFVSHRPVFPANAPGQPISPNLAGRTAAAFALCAQVYAKVDPAYAGRCLLAGQTLFDRAAHSWRGKLVASSPASYYSQPQWRADMELGATELYLATKAVEVPGLPHPNADDYLEPAATWADAYMSARTAGQDSLNLFDVSGIAHYDLYRVMEATGHVNDLETDASQVLRDLHDQLALGSRLGGRDPFGLGNPAGSDDTVPHALGYAIEAHLYDRLVGRPVFAPFAGTELGWVLGDNAWGSSFVVGAGRTFPHCLAHQVANLEGSLDGRGRLLAGATVDGPTDPADLRGIGAPDGFRRCAFASAAYTALDGHQLGYLDDVRSSSSSEPADDYTALSLLAFAEQAGG